MNHIFHVMLDSPTPSDSRSVFSTDLGFVKQTRGLPISVIRTGLVVEQYGRDWLPRNLYRLACKCT